MMGDAGMYMRKFWDLGVFTAFITANGAFLMLDSGFVFGCRFVSLPFKLMGGGCTVHDGAAAVVDADLPVVVPVGVPAGLCDMGKCGNNELCFGYFVPIFVKQLVADRALIIASKVHAEIGGSRAVVEEGLLPKSRQIGQSGISISPKLYIAFGISGASQHIVGIKNSSCIVAVNSDPYAPIFEVANYCVVDDCLNIITELNKLTLEGLTATL